MTKSTITREQAEDTIEGLEGLISRGVQSVYLDIAIAGLRQLLFAMDQKPALHRYRRKAVEPYGPYPWHYEEFVDLSRPLEGIEDEYYYAAPPAVSGFAVDGAPAENHIGSKNALDAIVSFIKSKSNPTVKCYEEVSEQLFKDNCHGIHSHVIEYILKLGEELEDLRAEQDESQLAAVVPDERDKTVDADDHPLLWSFNEGWNACRAAMLQAQSDDDGEPTDDERIMAIEGVHNCERCGDEGWVVGEMGITRCACNQGNPVFKIDLNSDFIKHVKAVSEKVRAGNSPAIPDGYVMVPKNLLSELRDWAHPEIEKYCEMWEGRRDSEFPALRKVIADADALLAAAQQEVQDE